MDSEGSLYDLELIAEKLRYASWRTWPAGEINSISSFFESWYQSCQVADSDDRPSMATDEIVDTMNALEIPVR